MISDLCCLQSTFKDEETEAERSYLLDFNSCNYLNTHLEPKVVLFFQHVLVPQALSVFHDPAHFSGLRGVDSGQALKRLGVQWGRHPGAGWRPWLCSAAAFTMDFLPLWSKLRLLPTLGPAPFFHPLLVILKCSSLYFHRRQ